MAAATSGNWSQDLRRSLRLLIDAFWFAKAFNRGRASQACSGDMHSIANGNGGTDFQLKQRAYKIVSEIVSDGVKRVQRITSCCKCQSQFCQNLLFPLACI